MGAGVDPKVLNAALRVSERAFAKKVSAAVPGLVFKREAGALRGYASGVCVIIESKVIHASNGEVAGWPIAHLSKGKDGASLYSPPWLGGCTVENVVSAFNNLKEV